MSIKTRIEIDNSELKKGLKDSENQAKKSMQNISDSAKAAGQAMQGNFSGVASVLSKLGPIGIAVGTAITAIGTAAVAAVRGISRLASSINSVAKRANAVDMTANAFLSLQHACNHAGISMEEMTNVLARIDFGLSQAAFGEEKMAKAFYALDISWRKFQDLAPEKQIAAMVEQFKKLQVVGKSVPKEVYDLLGRKGVQTLNKAAAEDDFTKLIASGSALGYNINENMIKNAQTLSDAYGDAGEKLRAWAVNLEATEKAMETIERVTKKVTENMNATGWVADEWQEQFEGIANRSKEIFQDTKNITDAEKKSILIAAARESHSMAGVPRVDSNYFANQRFVNLTSEQLDEEFKKYLEKLNWEKLPKEIRNEIFKITSRIDKRFNASDQSTWVQRIEGKSFDIQRTTADDAADSAQKILLAQEKELYQQDALVDKMMLRKSVEEQILEIETMTGAKIDSRIKKQMRENDELIKRKKIITETSRIQEASKNSNINTIKNLLATNGANKNILDEYFNALQTFNPQIDINEEWKRMLNVQLEKMYPSSKPMAGRNPELLMKTNPDVYFRAVRRIATAFTKGEIEIGNYEAFNKLLDTARNPYLGIIDKTFDTSRPMDTMISDFTEQSIKKIKLFEKEIAARKKDLEQLANMEQSEEVDTEKFFNEQQIAAFEKRIEKIKKLIEDVQSISTDMKYKEAFLGYSQQIQNDVMKENKLKFRETYAADRLELDIQKAQLTYNSKLEDTLKRINVLKKAGIEPAEENVLIYKDELDKMLQLEQAQKRVNLASEMMKNSRSMQLQALEKMGFGRQAALLQGRDTAQETLGRRLSESEQALVDRLSNMQYSLNNIATPQLKDDVIKTNDLARRGGFTRSVAYDRNSSTKSIIKLQVEIKKILEDSLKCQRDNYRALF